jgi:hypothetical protein
MNTPTRDDYQKRLTTLLADSLTAPIHAATPRHIHGTVQFPNKATSVIGMRRAGKSTYLHQLRREKLERGTDRALLPYINFEDEGLTGMTVKDLALLLDEYYRMHPAARRDATVTWCFDEIQLVPGWERFIRRVLDNERVEILLSGSSAALLSREVHTSLRGRGWEVLLHPFSFGEYLRHHGHLVPDEPARLTTQARSDLERAFMDYFIAGGFPETQGRSAADRGKLLQDYVDVAMLRDIVERHQVSNIAGLRWLVRQLLGNAGDKFSVEKFYKVLKSQSLSISKDTLHHLVGYLDDCFLVRTVWMEADSERQRMVNPRKIYPVDTGLIPVFDRTGRANTGHTLETVVLLELERRRMSVTYVRTASGLEVDFLARRHGDTPELIQVCSELREPDTLARELRALEEAAAQHPKATRRLLVLNWNEVPTTLPAGLTAQPVYEWLLSEPAS